jgi:hypothetical protein
MSRPTRYCPACYGPNLWEDDRCIACGTTLQTDESYDDRLMWALDHPDSGMPLDAEDIRPSVRRMPDDDLVQDDSTFLEAKGAGGALILLAGRVRIHHHGFRGLLHKALPAQKDVPLERIASVDWRSSGALRLGRIGFRLEPPSRRGVAEPEPDDRVMFYLHQEVAFREIKAEIERRLARRSAPDTPDLRRADPSGR